MTNNATIISDYHIHSPYCKHAHGKMIDYVENAILMGMQEICITDHLGRYYLTASQKKRYWDWGMSEQNLARYYLEIEDLKETYKDQITIRKGLEIDYIEGAEEILLSILKPYSFDFLLGSIHCLPSYGWKHIANYASDDLWPIFYEYFRVAKSMATAGIFNSIAHLDFIWRYSKWPAKKSNAVFEMIEKTIKVAIEHDLCIEINANGYLWSQIYTIRGGDPFNILLKKIKKYNAPITIGSDAHKPEFVGKAFAELAHILKKRGITHYYTFENRKKISQLIP